MLQRWALPLTLTPTAGGTRTSWDHWVGPAGGRRRAAGATRRCRGRSFGRRGLRRTTRSLSASTSSINPGSASCLNLLGLRSSHICGNPCRSEWPGMSLAAREPATPCRKSPGGRSSRSSTSSQVRGRNTPADRAARSDRCRTPGSRRRGGRRGDRRGEPNQRAIDPSAGRRPRRTRPLTAWHGLRRPSRSEVANRAGRRRAAGSGC